MISETISRALRLSSAGTAYDGKVVHRVRLPLETPGRLLGLELKLVSGQDELYVAAVQRAVALPPRTAA